MTYADAGFFISLYLTKVETSVQVVSPLSLLEIRIVLNFGINRGEITSEQLDAVLFEIDPQIEKGFLGLSMPANPASIARHKSYPISSPLV